MDVQGSTSISSRQSSSPAPVRVRPLMLKPHRLNGLSERLLVSHYENNYGGALRRLNAIGARLAGAPTWTRAPVFDINGIKREELIAAGSVILHEIYFDSGSAAKAMTRRLGTSTRRLSLAGAIERDFWQRRARLKYTEFTSMAKALAGGSGWAILAWSERLCRLVNQWAADHSQALSGANARPRGRHVRARLPSRFRRSRPGLTSIR